MAGKGKRKGGGKTGMAKSHIDWAIVESLCKIQCTDEEVAQVIGICVNTLSNRTKKEFGMTYQEYSLRFRKEGTSSIRRAQYKAAVHKGNPTMLIWLGKQYLGQSDKAEVSHDVSMVYLDKQDEDLG
ncbi:MAG: hypothetical protein ACUZ8E_17595 [Candidatus Anammoxibacter sp.]